MNRPTGVTVIAILSFLGAGLLVLFGCALLFGGAIIATLGMSVPAAMVGVGVAIAAVFFFGLAALDVVTGIGLLNMRNWARVITIVLVGLGLFFAVLGLLSGLLHFRIFLMFREAIIAAIDLWVLTYLFKPDIKQAFGATGF
jgi:hypothetical protein